MAKLRNESSDDALPSAPPMPTERGTVAAPVTVSAINTGLLHAVISGALAHPNICTRDEILGQRFDTIAKRIIGITQALQRAL